MEIHIIAQGKNDPPRLSELPRPIVDLSSNDKLSFCVVEGGMMSGEPSVMIISSDQQGSIILQTSLDKFLAAASGMSTLAKERWGWVMPEGYATIMPGDMATRKALLEQIRKELEEWDEVEG